MIPYIPNTCLQSLVSGSLTTVVIDFWFKLVARQSQGRYVAPDALLTRLMPGGIDPSEKLCNNLSDLLRGTHLLSPLIIGAHIPGHFVFVDVCHTQPPTITIGDPLGRAPAMSRGFLGKCINRWLHNERTRQDPVVAPCPDYVVTVNPEDLPLQDDGVSCGVFSSMYAYFRAVLGRWPTSRDFRGHHHMVLRLVILDACLRGCLRAGPDDDVVYLSPHPDVQPWDGPRRDVAMRVDGMTHSGIQNELAVLARL
jgi:hypothetical protein